MYSFLCDIFLFVSLFKLKLFCVIVCKARRVCVLFRGYVVVCCHFQRKPALGLGFIQQLFHLRAIQTNHLGSALCEIPNSV